MKLKLKASTIISIIDMMQIRGPVRISPAVGDNQVFGRYERLDCVSVQEFLVSEGTRWSLDEAAFAFAAWIFRWRRFEAFQYAGLTLSFRNI